jgi:hypothetical protein
VYPTVLRSVGVGSCSGLARAGAMLTPYIAQETRFRKLRQFPQLFKKGIEKGEYEEGGGRGGDDFYVLEYAFYVVRALAGNGSGMEQNQDPGSVINWEFKTACNSGVKLRVAVLSPPKQRRQRDR